MPSKDFAIRVYGERTTPDQRRAIGAFGCLMLYVGAKADARTHTAFVNLKDFAGWSGFSYRQAKDVFQHATALGVLLDVKRRSTGYTVTLGEMYQRAAGEDETRAERAYKAQFKRIPHRWERDMIRATVGVNAADVKLWQGVMVEWGREKHDPTDLDGLLGRFNGKRMARDKVLQAGVAAKAEVPAWASE